MLEIILRCDPVSPQRFSAGQGQIGFIAFRCALSVLRLSARKPGMFISPDGSGSWARCTGHKFRIWAWLCRYRLEFRDVFHVGPYAAPAERCDVDWRKCRAAIRSMGHCGRRSNFEGMRSWRPISSREGAERIHIDCVLDMSSESDFKLLAEEEFSTKASTLVEPAPITRQRPEHNKGGPR
jgi:hypothetical protein